MTNIFEKESIYCEVEVINNNIQITINEGRKQLNDYWIAKVENDVFEKTEVKGFVKCKTNLKVKTFTNIEDGEYMIQLGKGTRYDFSRRVLFTVKDKEIHSTLNNKKEK